MYDLIWFDLIAGNKKDDMCHYFRQFGFGSAQSMYWRGYKAPITLHRHEGGASHWWWYLLISERRSRFCSKLSSRGQVWIIMPSSTRMNRWTEAWSIACVTHSLRLLGVGLDFIDAQQQHTALRMWTTTSTETKEGILPGKNRTEARRENVKEGNSPILIMHGVKHDEGRHLQ